MRRDVVFGFILVSLNLFFLWPFLGKTYPEGLISVPVGPLAAAILDFFAPLSFWQSVGVLVVASFPAVSVGGYFWFKKVFSQSPGGAILAFAASLIFLLPFFLDSRVTLFWDQGDGFHGLSLALVPLVTIPFWEFLKKGAINSFLLVTLGTVGVALISPFGFLNLGIFLGLLTISEMLLGQARLKLVRFLAAFFFSLGGVAFWYHPAFLISLAQSPQGAQALLAVGKLIPPAFFIVPIFGTFSFLIFDRKPQLQPLFLAFSLTLFYLALTTASRFGVSVPSQDRFLPEFLFSLSLLVVTLGGIMKELAGGKIAWVRIHPRLGFVHHTGPVLGVALFVGLTLWPVFSLVSGDPLFAGQEKTAVLGAQSYWWEMPRFGPSAFFGGALTVATVIMGGILKWKIKQ